MADKTGIEWTDATWNPVVGCSIVSPGCTNCYAMGQAARIERMSVGAGQTTHYAGTTQGSKSGPVWTGKVALAPEHIITQPLRWKRPRRIFVNSMGDPFHEDVPDKWIDIIFAVAALCPQHTLQVLTKRSKRVREYFRDLDLRSKRIAQAILDMMIACQTIGVITDDNYPFKEGQRDDEPRLASLPLPNVWLGVSAEDQKRADERIPDLLATPAAVRFVSAEPLLGPIDFKCLEINGEAFLDSLAPLSWQELWDYHWLSEVTKLPLDECIEAFQDEGGVYPPNQDKPPRLDWIIVGGESGPGARPMHPDWARSIRDQCAAAGVPFFFKQWGKWSPVVGTSLPHSAGELRPYTVIASSDQKSVGSISWHAGHGMDRPASVLHRLGKRRAGRLLDGVEHNATPAARP